MLKLIETISSALAAAALLAAALGFAIVAKPLWASEPLTGPPCSNCSKGCPSCPLPEEFYCETAEGGDCDCKCFKQAPGCGIDLYYYKCEQPI